ncbi:MAG: 16S rRNA (cytosine(1402)-N(4))-methyltransferase RsmH, partial [Defluviitaleaceae bacterium]|nr:16S rRNA (cytosine(1402)-N(4))-methyltransferase RsmH [Defluviitaleaceae bacterium]
MSDYEHTPVLLEETVAGLNIRPGGVICDGTLGAAGHAKAIARRLETGTIIGIDRDAEAIEKAGQVLGEINRGDLVIRIFKDNFSNMDAVFDQAGIPAADGILLDLGMSSRHISEPSRGFSYSELGKIDMRMDRESPISGYDIINGFSEEKLIESFFRYGEERFSRAAASAIVARRLERPIETTTELAEIILSALPKKARYNGAGHQSVKRIFQAIRVEVNDEIGNLSKFLNKAP